VGSPPPGSCPPGKLSEGGGVREVVKGSCLTELLSDDFQEGRWDSATWPGGWALGKYLIRQAPRKPKPGSAFGLVSPVWNVQQALMPRGPQSFVFGRMGGQSTGRPYIQISIVEMEAGTREK